MTFQLPIVEKMGTLDEMIHIPPRCSVHLHGRRNKVVPLMKPFILVDISNGAKFNSCTCLLTNDIRSHCFPYQVNNHHINNKDLVFWVM
jgi:hypothetical protein